MVYIRSTLSLVNLQEATKVIERVNEIIFLCTIVIAHSGLLDRYMLKGLNPNCANARILDLNILSAEYNDEIAVEL